LNSSEQRNYLVSNAFLALASLPLILLSPIGTFFASAGALNSFNLKEMSIVNFANHCCSFQNTKN